MRHVFCTTAQMGRVASDAIFPQKCDHDAAGDAARVHRGDDDASHREFAGQGGRVNVDCIRSIDVASDFVALDDRLLQPLQRQRAQLPGKTPSAAGRPAAPFSTRATMLSTSSFTWELDATDVSRMAGHANYRIILDM
jgi:hypothetical protein